MGRYSIDVELRLDVEIVENSLISFHMIMSQYVNVMFSHHVRGVHVRAVGHVCDLCIQLMHSYLE